MKHLFFVLFLLLGICKLLAAEFDPSACPDLTAKIFQVNKDWAVFYVSADSYSHSGMGFQYSALQYQFFKNKYYTVLHYEDQAESFELLLYGNGSHHDLAEKDKQLYEEIELFNK